MSSDNDPGPRVRPDLSNILGRSYTPPNLLPPTYGFAEVTASHEAMMDGFEEAIAEKHAEEAARRREDLDNIAAQIALGRAQLDLGRDQAKLSKSQGRVSTWTLWVSVAMLAVAIVTLAVALVVAG